MVVIALTSTTCVSGDPFNMHFTNDMGTEGCALNLSCTPSTVDGTLVIGKGQKARVGSCELPKGSVNCHFSCNKLFNDITANVFLSQDSHDVYRVVLL